MSEETFTSVPLVGFKFLSEIENIAYSRLVRAAYVKEEFVGWISKKDAISKLSFLKKTAIYKIFNKLEELGLLEQKEKSYKVYILSSTAKRENNKWVDTRVYLDECNSSYKEYPSITTFESYKEVINEWTVKFSDKKIKNNKIEQVCGFTKLSDKVLYNTEVDLQSKIDWLRMRRIKDLEINTSKSEKPFTPNWKAVGTILGINGKKFREQITSTICATKDKKGFITNYTSSNNGFSFDITDELVNSDYNKRTDNQKKISDEEVEELTKDMQPAEEQLLEILDEKSDDGKDEAREESITLEKKKKYKEVPDDIDEFFEMHKGGNMISKEQIKLFEKKGGKKEDYNFEEIVSDNKKYYISTDADNKVFIVEENDYEDFLQKKREINKKRNEEIKQIKKRDCIKNFMFMLNKLSLKKLQNKWFSEGVSFVEMKNAAKEEILENWTNPYEFMYYPKTLSKDDMLDKDSICIMLKHNSKEDLIPFSIIELYVFNKLKNNEVFYTSDFEETFNPFEKSYCKEYMYRSIKDLSFEEKKEKIFSLSKDVWSEGFVVYLYNAGVISKKSKFNNYDPKNDAIFLINAINTGFENLEGKQKKRVHALVFEIVKDL